MYWSKDRKYERNHTHEYLHDGTEEGAWRGWSASAVYVDADYQYENAARSPSSIYIGGRALGVSAGSGLEVSTSPGPASKRQRGRGSDVRWRGAEEHCA